MKKGITSDILIIAISICAAIMSGNLYLTFLLSGTMLILNSARAIIRDHVKVLTVIQIAVSLVFSCVSGAFWGFTVFAVMDDVSPGAELVFSSISYVCYEFIRAGIAGSIDKRMAALLILRIFILLLIEGGLILIRKLVKAYEMSEQEQQNKILKAGLNELHEKNRNEELLRQNLYIEKNARLTERENISRNIHNSVGHSITAAIMTLDAADVLYDKDPDSARVKMNDANQRIRGSLESIRSAVRALDREEENTGIKDMICYIENIVDNFTMDNTIKVEKVYDIYSDDMMIPGEHAEFLTGALQEFLTNGVKHGKATEFEVHVIGDSGHLILSVSDNGKSAFNGDDSEAIRQGFGLKKIISYTERAGGRVRFENDGTGFKAEIELPFDPNGYAAN